MTTIQQLAAATSAQFTRGQRNDNAGRPVWIRKHSAGDWIRSMCMDAHDGLPNDWTYAFIVASLDAIAEFSSADEDCDERHEAVDGIVSICTHELHSWAADGHSHYVDRAQQELGTPADASMDQRLMTGQFLHIDEVFQVVYDALSERLRIEEHEPEAARIAERFDRIQAELLNLRDSIDEDTFPTAHARACELQEQAEEGSDADTILEWDGLD